jgi:hypothetical protein
MRWRHGRLNLSPILVAWLGIAVCLLVPKWSSAQGISGPTVGDSKVGYIDSAIPGNVFRLRYDTAYNFNRPSRAEFFYAQNAPAGPGLPLPERSVDYQDISAYGEIALLPSFSAFVDLPVRFLNPDINDNTAGFSDMNAGVKYALVDNESGVFTLQLRTYIPTGNSHRGLGTHHVSLEPAVLCYKPVGERGALEGELRYWVPVGGTDFAGDIVRYGIGYSHRLLDNGSWRVTPVAEFVGWTVLDGQQSTLLPTGFTATDSAAGDTILNLKVGARVGIFDRADLYAGWGRALTGERWYENIFRVEIRFLY